MADKKMHKYIFNSIIQFLFLSTLTFLAMFTTCIADDNLNVSNGHLQTVTLQLKWKHQFQFAGYYAALEKGYYSEAGLDVKIIEIQSGEESINKVIDGKADFGIAMSDLILHRANGKPVVALASIFQHSPLIILTPKASGIENIHVLKGKRLGLEAHSTELIAYLENEGLSLEEIKLHPHDYSISNLISGEVDAISAYSTDEPFLLFNKGIEYNIFTPRSGGIDFYGDTLFTSEAQIKENPERVSAFLNASLKGWQYALENSEEIIDLILSKYTQRHSREHLLFEAQHSKTLIMADVVQLGYMNPGRWNNIAETYAKLGQIDKNFSLKGFVYVSESGADYGWLKRRLLSVIGIAIAILAVILMWNRRLSKEITERKQAEEALRKSEALHQEAQRVAKIGHWELDSPSGKPLWSEEVFHIFGLDPKKSEPSFSAHVNIIHDEDWDLLDHSIQELSTNGTPFDIEFRILRPGGGIRWMHARGSANKNEDGSVARMFGTAQDITDRKQIEETLQESEAKYRRVSDNSPAVLYQFMMTPDGAFSFPYVSDVVEATIGISAEEIMKDSSKFLGMVHPEDQKMFQESIMKSVESLESFPLIFRCMKDGGEIWVETRGTPAPLADGGMLWDGFLLNITKRKQAEEEREKLQEEVLKARKLESLGTLAGGIAHDLNNLLFAVMGNISLAQDDLKPETGTSENLKEAEQACIKAKELSARLITFSKGGDPVKKMMSIKSLLKNTVISALSGSDIKPEISISDDIRQANIDEGQIKQVVRNIVANAKEAMDDNGQLTVSCENVDIAEEGYMTLSKGEYIKISFKDHGCGISKENLKKIFDPYFSTKDMGADKGQGLGLTICYSIIKKHGGLINVESKLETGSTFSIYLPAFLVKEPELQKSEEKPVAQKPVKKPAIGTGKILLMDDEEAIRTLLGRVINRLGHDVESCIEGRETVEIYTNAMESKEPFDMVILDLTSKIGMGGQETMRRLLEIDPDVKGIIITGYSDDPVVANFRAYGFSGFVIKPTTMDELSEVINEVLSKDQ
ncbi:ABC transporter substrate-binding protein [Desulfobacula sp.]|uniref:ABC transporter substrate-binding protein n=1 Tax=Desulfobacula sp. TaxID=2593537 RepID=UPI001ECC42F4|nr:ABC transporter substrate-binding protein [Desulfobacula sp.]